eukprot:TRINITY_DN2707_c1_g1_i7.p1 TRINITY_DN2707_c1_g1~~TRINITY_DN2707_c1_g1_i7.p1  ORF type:complete len:562 (-),score=92.90 TRINITY_DN2707_c1_g1_i7:81-1613(-)
MMPFDTMTSPSPSPSSSKTSEECLMVTSQFSQCLATMLQNNTCVISEDTGYISWCPPCDDLYAGWTSCHCNDITVPYGIGDCMPLCTIFFWCAAKQAYDYGACAADLAALTQCGNKTQSSSTSSSPSLFVNNDKLDNDDDHTMITMKTKMDDDDAPPSPSSLPSSLPPPKVLVQQLLFTNASFPYCHVCSIVENDDGSLVAVFQAGPYEDSPQSSIWTTRKLPNAQDWSPPVIALTLKGVCSMNPSLYQNEAGVIFLTFHYGGNPDGSCNTDRWKGAYIKSLDGGVTWQNTSITYLPTGYLGGIKNKCIKLSNGAVLCPSSTESTVDTLIEFWQAHVETTNDNFTAWNTSNEIQFNYANDRFCVYYGTIQPTLTEIEPGHVLSLQRTGCGVIAQSHSYDYGRTFESPARPTSLPNPNAGIDSVLMKGQKDIGVLLAYNNSPTVRTPLSIAHSVDGGKTWEHLLDLETNTTMRFMYPAVIQSKRDPRAAHVCYTHVANRNTMAYAKLEFQN